MNDIREKVDACVRKHAELAREARKIQEAQYQNKRILVAMLMDDHAIDCLDVNFTRVSRMYNTANPKYMG